MTNRSRPTEGTYLFLLGLVVIVASPDRFWLGFVLALAPIMMGAVVKAVSAGRSQADRPSGRSTAAATRSRRAGPSADPDDDAIEAEFGGSDDVDSDAASTWSPFTDPSVKRRVTKETADGEVIWFEMGGAASVEWRETPREHVDQDPPTRARVELAGDFITWSSLTPARAATISSDMAAAAAFAQRLNATPPERW